MGSPKRVQGTELIDAARLLLDRINETTARKPNADPAWKTYAEWGKLWGIGPEQARRKLTKGIAAGLVEMEMRIGPNGTPAHHFKAK